ncbi:MAG: hypothetical protein WC479_10120 [Candidatus Izemoplasmatales bacterium]|jgi:hypothetical protein
MKNKVLWVYLTIGYIKYVIININYRKCYKQFGWKEPNNLPYIWG